MKKFPNYFMQLHIAFVLGVEPDLVLNSKLYEFCMESGMVQEERRLEGY